MVKKRTNVVIQSRDLRMLRGLFECRVMTSRHASELYFGGRSEMAKKRLQRLRDADIVASRSDRRFEKTNFFLTRRGIEILALAQMLADFPKVRGLSLARRMDVSDLTLRHELAVMDVKVSFHRTAPMHGVEVREFGTWPARIQFKSERGLIKPDAFLRIRDRAGRERTFYLELDRSTKPLGALVEQCMGYRACRKARVRLTTHSWDEDAREHRFTVLYVLQNEGRLENFARKLLSSLPPIRSLVWLTTMDALERDPFGAIWLRPKDLETHPGTRVTLFDGI